MSAHPTPPEPRELTQSEADALVHDAFACERRIKSSIAAIHADTWALAEALYDFHELRGWTLLGYETLGEFLAQPDIGLSRSWFFRLIQTWRDLVVIRKVSPARLAAIDATKVEEIRPAIMSGSVKPEAALADAEALGRRDLREKYRPSAIARHGQQPDGSTTLDADAEPIRTRCPQCDGSGWTTEEPS